MEPRIQSYPYNTKKVVELTEVKKETSFSDQETASLALRGQIEQFADQIANYLMPSIKFVGDNEALYEVLAERYSWLDQEETLTASNHEIVVIDHLPENFMQISATLPRRVAFVVIENTRKAHPKPVREYLGQRISVTLYRPTIDQISWHINGLLLLAETTYRIDGVSEEPLISMDVEYRAMLRHFFNQLVSKKDIDLRCGSKDEAESVVQFISEVMPDEIKPITIGRRDVIENQLQNSRVHILKNPTRKQLDQIKKYVAVPNIKQSPIILVITWGVSDSKDSMPIDEINDGMSVIEFPEHRSRSDRELLAYYAATQLSHQNKEFLYTAGRYRTSKWSSCSSVLEYVKQLMRADRSEIRKNPDETLTQLIDDYKRMSLNGVMNDLESNVLDKLQESTSSVSSAARAAGIPEVTYFKRKKRHSQRNTALKIHTSEN